MSVRGLGMACCFGAALLATRLAGAQEELRNDGFVDGQSAGFQSGFVAGEAGASRFTASGPGTLVKVQFLFGGGVDGVKKDLNVHVWNDTAMTDDPGIELYAGTYGIISADMALQEVDLTDKMVTVPATFRVGVEMLHDGLPSIARDNDDTIDPEANFVLVNGMTWSKSSDLGVTGDWIIRAFVDTGAGGAGGSGGSTGGAGGATNTGGMSAGGSGGMTTSGGGGAGGDTQSGDEGCGCRAAGPTPSGPAPFVLLGMLAVYVARRRRGEAQTIS